MSRPSVDSFSLLPPVSRPPPVEIAFLLDHGVAPALLDRAAVIARRQGVSADRALIAEGLLSEAFFYRALAAELGAPFLESLVRVTAEGMQTIADGYARLRARRLMARIGCLRRAARRSCVCSVSGVLMASGRFTR